MSDLVPELDTQEAVGHGVSLSCAFGVWLRVAALSFGGPAGQIAVMHRILVQEKRWISDARFLHALNYCMLLPGPEAQQLAIYIGWLMHKTRGGIMAGGLFILPGILAMMALSIVYAEWGRVGYLAGAFFGLNAAVLAVVIDALIRVGRRALKGGPPKVLAAASFIAIYVLGVPFPLIIIIAGALGFVTARLGSPAFGRLLVPGAEPAGDEDDSLLGETTPDHARPDLAKASRIAATWLALWIVPTAAIVALLGTSSVFSLIAIFFSKMALVTFGGAYAVLAYVAQQAVSTYHWLAPREMLDGLGLAESTPGPLVMVLQFVGFMAAFRVPGGLSPLAAGVLGGLLATWVTFVPCFLWIFLGAPYIERLRGNRLLAGALSAITAAVAGVILNLAVWFAIHTLFGMTRKVAAFGGSLDVPVLASLDMWRLSLAVAASVAIFRFRVGIIATLAASCAAGVALYAIGLA